MSSSQPFLQSSPLSLAIGGARRTSQFTYKHLSQLSSYTTTCPLRVIAHIDLDAFYAQCEMIRLGIPETQPLGVQQWQGLIAINYPARAFGLNRHVTPTEAKKQCPDIIMQHVATWKEGDEKWAYHEDAEKHMGTHKVSLDPYRLESRRILACIKKALPDAPLQKVEKASIDEVFMDLSAQIHSILLERFPELRGPAPYDDPTENLPPPPTSALEWDTDALVDLDSHETEDDDPDWDDIAMLIGSEIVRSVRAAIKEELKYTCSGGVSHNKMLAKLGSAHKKPNQQTVIRNRAVNQFLGSFKFTKIRNLGGKLGEDIVSTFGTEEVKELLEVPLEQLKKKVGDDTGSWVYHIIRGQDTSEVNSRTQIKSMLSAKSFRPSINSYDQAVRWLRIFVADIFSRLVEEGVLDNKRRPKTLNLHHRQGAQTRSRQIPIPSGKSISEAGLFGLAKTVLGQVIVDGRAWPCANLSLSVGGFEDGPTGNKGIGTFLVKGEEAKAMNATRQAEATTFDSDRPAKRQKMESASIQNFFGRSDSLGGESGAASEEDSKDHTLNDEQIEDDIFLVDDTDDSKQQRQQQASLDSFYCEKCSKSVSNEEKAEHDDWHFAKELQESERVVVPPVTPATTPSASVTKKTPFTKPQRGRPRTQPGGLNPGKGQSKLNFGR